MLFNAAMKVVCVPIYSKHISRREAVACCGPMLLLQEPMSFYNLGSSRLKLSLLSDVTLSLIRSTKHFIAAKKPTTLVLP
eukprot:2439119-Amphidinium_carterae.1